MELTSSAGKQIKKWSLQIKHSVIRRHDWYGITFQFSYAIVILILNYIKKNKRFVTQT